MKKMRSTQKVYSGIEIGIRTRKGSEMRKRFHKEYWKRYRKLTIKNHYLWYLSKLKTWRIKLIMILRRKQCYTNKQEVMRWWKQSEPSNFNTNVICRWSMTHIKIQKDEIKKNEIRISINLTMEIKSLTSTIEQWTSKWDECR